MPDPTTPTLDEQIAEAEAAGNWRRAGLLKNRLLIAQHAAVDHNGYPLEENK